MKKIIRLAIFVAGMVNSAMAANTPDTPLVTGPNFQQVPAGQIYVTPNGGSQTTLGAALANGGGGGTPGGSNGQIQFNNLGAFGGTPTGSGVLSALANAPNGSGGFVTFSGALGTPTSGTLTNATGLPLAGLAQSGASNNQVPQWNGTAWVPATVSGGSGCATTGCTYTGPITTVGITDSGGINTTYSAGYQVGGAAVINSFANQTSPIVSPEVSNIPSPDAIYIPHPVVNGWNESVSSSSVNTYSSMISNYLAVNGTATAHYGYNETSLALTAGTGTPNLTGELNLIKTFVQVGAGVQINVGENNEGNFNNLGTTSQWTIYQAQPIQQASGTLAVARGYTWSPTNYNTTAGSFGSAGSFGFSCNALGGTGSAIPNGYNVCLLNFDPKSDIENYGHYRTRASTSPTVSAGCTIDAGNDETGTVTAASGTQSQCVITFFNPYPGGPYHAVISSSNGSQILSYSLTSTALTINTVASTGWVFTYRISG